MRVGVIGGGIEGQAAVRYWQNLGAAITVHDRSVKLVVPDGVATVTGEDYLKNLDDYDLLVRSPGVKPTDIVSHAPVTSGTKEFFARCPARIIGVTGTKGKGTTSTLITKILEQAGKRVWLGGNIGRPALDFLPNVKASDIVVLELSSFQLMDLDVSPHIAVCLMIVPEHMDWHKNMREYVAAKGNLFWHQQPGDVAIFNSRNDFSTQVAQLSPGRKVTYFERPGANIEHGIIKLGETDICRVSEVGLIGAHNLENICAAITAAAEILGDKPLPMARAVREFKGLPHRLETVATIDGVTYVNDSYSSNPGTTAVALKAFNQPAVLILGGSDKKADFGVLVEAVRGAHVQQVIVIGNTTNDHYRSAGPDIEEALAAINGLSVVSLVRPGGASMATIIKRARAAALPGDVVLLSPACASFDMFDNASDRGDQFREQVQYIERKLS